MSREKKNSKSLPPISTKHSYIERSIQLLDAGCYANKKLRIDDAIGDYRMGLFRLKEKRQYLNNIKTIFTSSFTDSLLPKDKNNKDIRDSIYSIINKSNNQALNQPESYFHIPKLKKEKSIKNEVSAEEVSQIKHEKGNYMSTLQQDDYLICSYLPEYEQKRWFQLKNRNTISPTLSQNNEISNTNKLKRKSLLKINNKPKHIFAYLSNSIYLQKYK